MEDETYYGFIYLWENQHPDATKYKKYIGQHVGRIDDGYTGSGTIFKKYFYSKKYYGFWYRTILKYCKTKQELDDAEITFINEVDAVNNILFCNSKSGGTGKGGILSEDARRKMSESKQGKTPWNKGIPCAHETKLKLSNKLKGRKAWNEGKKCKSKSLEVKQKHSIALLQFHNKKKIIKERQVLNFITENRTITTKQIREIIGTSSKRSALRIIWSLIGQNKIKKEYRGPRNIVYTLI
jgi:hypothetical protein